MSIRGHGYSQLLQPSPELDNMIRCINICHDVLRLNGKLSGSSQDELISMETVEGKYNCKFVGRDTDYITLDMRGSIEKYKIVKIYEFNSDRKMMSLTVQNCETGIYYNFAKGADMVIKERLSEIEDEEKDIF